MKRLERLGSVVLFTITITLVLHILAMSSNQWKTNICRNCDPRIPLASWSTSLLQRCYDSSVATIFSINDSNSNENINEFVTQLCIPNKFIVSENPYQAMDCLTKANQLSDIYCSIKYSNLDVCQCDYSSGTKGTVAMTILAACALGILVLLTHLVSFVTTDYMLKWLIPFSFSLLIFSIVCIFITLIFVGSTLKQDVYELRDYLHDALYNVTINATWVDQLNNFTEADYDVKIGWCFGIEIVALYFSVISLVLYGLIFVAKKRPE
ncbi:unnamed protein product [Rotaria sordida]|uniref:Uncharacterized protein n=1 Tax=Rotaria sordida TaxID=392033 RepID=A0A814I7X8_9BILA|nr:unnamed protein product [Rotaria sordida]CAF1020226.1 unnamed protein product [Rotaria sordida]CAF4085713.1 unnamed protein product [Rotaria sordida]CAF4111047.1 unnamed protein product [Rotaria sordida]